MTTFILIHGSWHGGETWHRVQKRMENAGHRVLAPTLSGMAVGVPGGPETGLTTHVADIANLIQREGLQDVVLAGHSYGGFVMLGALAQVPDRIGHLVFVDAFYPASGQSLFNIMGAEAADGMRHGLVDAQGLTASNGARSPWLLPAGDAAFFLGDGADPSDVAWLAERLVPTPVRTFEEAVQFDEAHARAKPKSFIRFTRFPYYFDDSAAKVVSEGGAVTRIDAAHDAMLTHPEQVAAALMLHQVRPAEDWPSS